MIGLALIVKGVEEEADVLKRLLANIQPHIDGLFITITHKEGEKPHKKVVDVAELFDANITYFTWVNDFAKARNFSFKQVPKEYDYIMWADADDVFRGLETLKKSIEENPETDAFAMNYLYDFDAHKNPTVVHTKTMVVKNDDCVEWAGALHEDFKENRKVVTKLLKDVERLHLTDDDRIEVAKTRNAEIAQEDADAKPDDPRSYWNLGNALHGAGKFEESNKALDKFLKMSSSDEEKYIIRLRRAENYWNLDEMNKGLEEARYAVGMRPDYPDGYHLLGQFYHKMGLRMEAAKVIVQGLLKKPPYHSIIVYNPRDYDYNPMSQLAKIYYEMNRADLALPLLKGCLQIVPQDEGLKKTVKIMEKEAKKVVKALEKVAELEKLDDKEELKKKIDILPIDIKSHPYICFLRNKNFIKKESSGKDLVIYCGYTSEEWSPETAKTKGIGGSEEAVIHLAKRWKDAGYNVTVYNSCGTEELEFDGVKYKPEWSWNYRDKQDITIIWRAPRFADYEINSDKIFLDLHDVIDDGEFTESRLEKIDKVFVKTEFHKTLFPSVPKDKFVVIPNGIDSKIFEEDLERDPMLLINTSSPDRSMASTTEIFRRIKKQVPEAKMKWAYGWGVFDVVHGSNDTIMTWKKAVIDEMEKSGIENLGRVSHSEVAKLYLTSTGFLYPTEFAEIHCISAVKAQAGGSLPITTNFAALDETVAFGTKVKSKKDKTNWCMPNQFDFGVVDEEMKTQLVQDAVDLLKNPPSEEERKEMREWARKTYDWDVVADNWLKEF